MSPNIMQYLLADAGIRTLAGIRIYPDLAPPKTGCPYIVVTEVSSQRFYSLTGYSGARRVRYQISCFDTDSTRCRILREEVIRAMEAWPSANAEVQLSHQAGDASLYEEETETHHKSVDFMVVHE